MSLERVRDDLVTLSRRLGEPAVDAVILGEGNTSARVDERTFLVKGSGCQLATIQPTDLVHLRFDGILPLLKRDDGDLDAAYESAKVDRAHARKPSIETLFHAACLSLPGVNAVAHTHPQAVNALTCSAAFPAAFEGRIFPDEAVVLGPASVFIPYLDPGVPLARAIHEGASVFLRERGVAPKTIYMQNHGVIALGASTTEAFAITLMAIKAARIRLGALAAGGINRLPEAVVSHLIARPDERARQKMLTV